MSERFDNSVTLAVCSWGSCARSVARGQGICRHHMIVAWSEIEAERKAFADLPDEFLAEAKDSRLACQPIVPQVVRPNVGWVYYVKLPHGDIKIGYSKAPRDRIAQLRVLWDDVLALEPGDQRLEAMRHDQFKGIRRSPRREDFAPSEDLMSHIAMLFERFGIPDLRRTNRYDPTYRRRAKERAGR